ncbi:unnamed protein product [Parnassius apollo]|uniref:(apollo) hypothetical protein n=1 Tax=Parnassius apollo TaxID=110799 RepID=A0A8S3W546_PARAO|nr:unnamed protein product [Parnassius apollo]
MVQRMVNSKATEYNTVGLVRNKVQSKEDKVQGTVDKVRGTVGRVRGTVGRVRGTVVVVYTRGQVRRKVGLDAECISMLERCRALLAFQCIRWPHRRYGSFATVLLIHIRGELKFNYLKIC